MNFDDLNKPSEDVINQIKKRGVAVVHGVIPEQEARGYKNEVEEYVRANPWTNGTVFDSMERICIKCYRDVCILM